MLAERKSLLLPTIIVSFTLALLLFIGLLTDSRSSFGNAALMSSYLGIAEIQAKRSAILFLSIFIIPLPFLSYQAIALASSTNDPVRRHAVKMALLHPIAVFLFLFELTFTITNDPKTRKGVFWTRIFLGYLFLMIAFSIWLGNPYRTNG